MRLILPNSHFSHSYLLPLTLWIVRATSTFVTDCSSLHYPALPSHQCRRRCRFGMAVPIFDGSSVLEGVVATRGLWAPLPGLYFLLLRTVHKARLVRSFRIIGGSDTGSTMFLGIGGVRGSLCLFQPLWVLGWSDSNGT